MKKNTIIENVRVEKLGYKGIGISKFDDGKTIIIKGGVLPGSVVDCIVTRSKKDYIEARIHKMKSLSDNIEFESKVCPHYFFDGLKSVNVNESKYEQGCGGCKWQILPYEIQLEYKQQIVDDSFWKISNRPDTHFLIQRIIPSPIRFGYRNKMEFSFGNGFLEDGWTFDWNSWKLGLHKQGSFAQVIDINNCSLISDKANKILIYIKNILKKSGFPVYNQKLHKGFYRHLVIREGVNSGQILINLSVALGYLEINKQKDTWTELKQLMFSDEYLIENVNSFIVTYNDGWADVVKGENCKVESLWGGYEIYEKLRFEDIDDDLSFRVGVFSFFQVNTIGAQLMFKKAASMIGGGAELMLDLYCGTGIIGITFCKLGLAKELIGVEIVKEAIEDAKFNAQINGLEQASYFVAGKAEKIVFQDQKIKDRIDKIELVVVDPPREGLHKNVIRFLGKLKKISDFKLLYISCNPVTMVANIGDLMDLGFDFKELCPIDMFPHTHHIECIGLLQ